MDICPRFGDIIDTGERTAKGMVPFCVGSRVQVSIEPNPISRPVEMKPIACAQLFTAYLRKYYNRYMLASAWFTSVPSLTLLEFRLWPFHRLRHSDFNLFVFGTMQTKWLLGRLIYFTGKYTHVECLASFYTSIKFWFKISCYLDEYITL